MAINKMGENTQILFGETIETPTDYQGNQHRIRWAGRQDELQDKDLPYSKMASGTDNHNLNNYGRNQLGVIAKNDPHNKSGKGTRVIGLAINDQDVIGIATMGTEGSGQLDGSFQANSDLPNAAKDQNAEGGKGGDINQKAQNKSVLQYASDEGGPNRKPSKFHKIRYSEGHSKRKTH